MQTTQPFHETIVKAIRRCNPSPSNGEILNLFQLIKETEITHCYDSIFAAIDEYFNFPGGGKWVREIREVKDSLLQQKQVGFVRGDDLDDLNRQVTSALIKLEEAERKVSFIEEAIAKLTKPNNVEGEIARQGAVRAAVAGRDEERARMLVRRFCKEKGASKKSCAQLKALLK